MHYSRCAPCAFTHFSARSATLRTTSFARRHSSSASCATVGPVLQKGAHRGLHLCHIPAPLRLRARVLAARRAAAAVCLVAHAPCLLFHVYGGGGRARRARFCRRVRAAPLTLPCRLHPCSRRRGLLDYHFAPVGSRVEMELAIVREAHLALVQVYVVATRVPAHRASWHIWHGPLGRFQIRQRRLRQRALPCCLLTH